MTPFEALEEVKKELESLFGKGLTGTIIISARNKSKVPIIGMTVQHFAGMVEHVCADERVVGMLGAAGTRQKLTKWRKFAQ